MSDSDPGDQSSNLSFERERGVYAIHVVHDVAHAVISIGDDALRVSRILQAFRVLAAADIAVFLIKFHRTAVTLALAGSDVARAESVLTEAGYRTTTRRDLALVSVRAASMRELSGVMIEIADALYAAGARLYEMGDSHNSVQCLIEGARVSEAVEHLCETFRLETVDVQESRLEMERAR